ncbi:Pathogenesis-related transcriptional factor and ERF protein (fragment) [Cupriavidus taiwanensis]
MNLRVCSHAQNIHNTKIRKSNTSGFKGVSFRKERGTWDARIRFNGKRHCIRGFATAEEANTALCLLRDGLHGEFANHG